MSSSYVEEALLPQTSFQEEGLGKLEAAFGSRLVSRNVRLLWGGVVAAWGEMLQAVVVMGVGLKLWQGLEKAWWVERESSSQRDLLEPVDARS